MSSSSDHQRYNAWTKDEHVVFYSKSRPPYHNVVIPWVIEYYHRMHPSNGSNIPLAIDVACGSGLLTAKLAESCERVIGIDVSPAMIAIARQCNRHPNVQYKVGSAQRLKEACAGEKADIITVGLAIDFFNNEEFYSQVRQLLRPGGVFAVLGCKTPGLQLEGLENFMFEYMADQFPDEPFRSVMRSVSSSYSDIHIPFEDEERRSTRIMVPVTRERIRERLMSMPKVSKDGQEGIEKVVKTIPAEGTFEMICDVFAILTHV